MLSGHSAFEITTLFKAEIYRKTQFDQTFKMGNEKLFCDSFDYTIRSTQYRNVVFESKKKTWALHANTFHLKRLTLVLFYEHNKRQMNRES